MGIFIIARVERSNIVRAIIFILAYDFLLGFRFLTIKAKWKPKEYGL